MWISAYFKGNFLSDIFLLLTFFSPIISLIVHQELITNVHWIKSKGLIYFFVLLIAFVLARSFFLIWIEMISNGINNFFQLSSSRLIYFSSIMNGVFCFSTWTYWYFINKLMKIKDNVSLYTLSYVLEAFWVTIVITVISPFLSRLIY
jgi:hypothetical protein